MVISSHECAPSRRGIQQLGRNNALKNSLQTLYITVVRYTLYTLCVRAGIVAVLVTSVFAWFVMQTYCSRMAGCVKLPRGTGLASASVTL